MAETRDQGRNSSVNQLGRALQAYATSDADAEYPLAAAWMQDLVDTGEISAPVPVINNSLTLTGLCTINVENGFCYAVNAAATPTEVIVYSALEATKNRTIGTCGGTAAWSVWSSVDGRTGIVCTADYTPGNEPAFAALGQDFEN